MKGLIIIIGESFRLGGQGTRIRGVPESYDQQINACNTHIKFLDNLKNNFNCESSVYISTYDTIYNTNLLDIYNNYLIGYKIYNDPIGLTQLFKNSIIDNKNDLNKYNFIFYFRIDLFLKDHFFSIFNPSWETIRFPTICWILYNVYNGKPRVNDMMLFIPNKFFDHLDNMPICHESWYIFYHDLKIDDNDMDVMINTYHDSDSQKDFNPLYYIVNRPENTVWHSENEIFVKPITEKFHILKKKKTTNNIIKIFIFIIIIFLIFN